MRFLATNHYPMFINYCLERQLLIVIKSLSRHDITLMEIRVSWEIQDCVSLV